MFHHVSPRRILASVVTVVGLAVTSVAFAGQHWGPFKDDGCQAADSKQFSSILWDIPWGESWEQACWNTPGLEGRVPNRCVNAGGHMWGEWDIYEPSCGP